MSRRFAWPGLAIRGGSMSAGSVCCGRVGTGVASGAGGRVGGQGVLAAGGWAPGCAGAGSVEVRCSIWSRRARMRPKLGSCRLLALRWRIRRAEDFVKELADDVEASESWSEEDPSEAGEAESAELGAGGAGGRCGPLERRGGRGGAVGTAKVVLRGGGGGGGIAAAAEDGAT
jgi:hypothetical protein